MNENQDLHARLEAAWIRDCEARKIDDEFSALYRKRHRWIDYQMGELSKWVHERFVIERAKIAGKDMKRVLAQLNRYRPLDKQLIA